MIKYKIRGSDWLTLALIIVNFNHFFIQAAPDNNCVSIIISFTMLLNKISLLVAFGKIDHFCISVATQRENSIRKSAIPSGTWSPQSSTPEPGHVVKTMRDKTNNDVMKLLMAAGPERPATPTRLYKLAPSERQHKVTTTCQAPTSTPVARPRTGASAQSNQGNKMTSTAQGNGSSAMKSGVFLRTVHALYRSKRAEDDVKDQWNEGSLEIQKGKNVCFY